MRDTPADPFRERTGRELRWRTSVLGARFEFSSNSRELLDIAREAFASVPQHRLRPALRGVLRLHLRHAPHARKPAWIAPPVPALSSGGGMLLSHVDAANFAIVDPRHARALVQVTDSMLRHRRLLRYELIEFAVINLATRSQGLVPLHAGCVGTNGRGVLLLGASGSGKSTLTLHAALGGLDFLAEDSVFVQPSTLRATGFSAYVHAREEALKLIPDTQVRAELRRTPRIQRRSGVRKREIDLRHGLANLAPTPLRIVATVVLSSRNARGHAGLVPLTRAQLLRVLRAEQSYATTQPGWREFERRVLLAGGFSLGRIPPADAVSSLRTLLGVRSQ